MTFAIIGLDGSLAAYGWSIVGFSSGEPGVHQAGSWLTKPDTKSRNVYQADRDGARLDVIAAGLLSVIGEAKGDYDQILVSVEAPIGNAKNLTAVKALAMVYGVSRTACAAFKVVPMTVQMHHVKAAIGGFPGASKDDVAAGVTRLTRYTSSAKTKPAREAEYDAIAVALTAMRHPVASALIGGR